MRINNLWLPLMTTLAFGLYAEEGVEKKEVPAVKEVSMSVDSRIKNSHESNFECRLAKLESGMNGFKTHNAINGVLSLDFLYWRGGGNDWFYGLSSEPGTAGDAKVQRQDLSWKPGARVGLSFSGLYDWTLGLVWTYYNNKSSVRTTKSLQDIYNSVQTNLIEAKVKLEYNTADLEFGSNFRLNKTFEFKPFFGLRGAWIKRNQYHASEGFNQDQPPEFQRITFSMPYRFDGYGPRVGTLAFCNFGDSGFSFFGGFSSTLLYGKVKSDFKMEISGGEGGPGSIVDSLKDLKANLQLLTGVNYKYVFDCETKSFFIRAGWESNYYWDLSDSFFLVGTGGGDGGGMSVSESYEALILYGGNFGIGFEY